jgi:succinoglycan biosynthesis protein ExoA
LRVLGESGADRVGGPWRVRPVVSTDPMQCAVAAVSQAMGSPNAESSAADFNGWVNSVYSGCWPRSTFERFGGFDDRMARLQDDEYDLRIARGGGLIWQSSRLRSVCRVEASLSVFFRDHLRMGYWKPFVIKQHGKLPSLSHYGPVCALLLASLSAPLSLVTWSVWPLALAVLGGVIPLGLSLLGVWRGQASSYGWPVLLRLPLVVGAYHAGRGLGFLRGVWALLRRRKHGSRSHHAAFNGRA